MDNGGPEERGHQCGLKGVIAVGQPPGDDCEQAHTAAAHPNIAAQDNGIRKVNHSEIRSPSAHPENSTPLP